MHDEASMPARDARGSEGQGGVTPELSVIICAHDPRPNYLARTLEALRAQTLGKEHWELLLVDNGSAQPLAKTVDLSWHPLGRHVAESELGLSSARRRGMAEALAELMVFVDDDNILDPDYLAQALRIRRDWPQLGTFGSGATIPEFELEPKPHLRELVPNLALRDEPAARWSNVFPCGEATPWGAGLCITRRAAEAYIHDERHASLSISDRRGKSLLSGGDVEMSFAACDAGLGMGVFPQLKLTHLIPKERVSEAYLVRLFEGILTSNYMLSYKWKGHRPPSPLSARALVSVAKNALLRRGLERRMYFANLRATMAARRAIAEVDRRRQSDLAKDAEGPDRDRQTFSVARRQIS
jgi:glycosyltransferase involved in cell wall biosynthesis